MSFGHWGSLPPSLLAVLFGVAMLAGCIDAIAGGGGLLCVPTMLWAGLPPAQTLATNKVQSAAGTLSATLHFQRAGAIDLAAMRWVVVAVLVGAVAGSVAVQSIDPGFLRTALPWMLMGIAAYFLFKPSLGELDRQQRLSLRTFTLTAAPLIGFYDGFFGPGAGSFYAIALVDLLGFNLTRATANTKLLNLAALLTFLVGGNVVWSIGLVMGAGQFIGARAGSHLVLTRGAKLVRPLLVAMSVALTIKLLSDDPDNWAHHLMHRLGLFKA
jgi:uncharacterized membrane protein YfcA